MIDREQWRQQWQDYYCRAYDPETDKTQWITGEWLDGSPSDLWADKKDRLSTFGPVIIKMLAG